VVFIGFKESNGLTMSFLLIYLLAINRHKIRQVKFLVPLLVFCLVWTVLCVKVLIPAISGQPYLYSPLLPGSAAQFMADSDLLRQKISLVEQSFYSFGFLLLISPLGLIPILGELSFRLLPIHSRFQNFTLGLHYNVYLGIFMAIASIQSLAWIKQKTAKSLPYAYILLALLSLVICGYTARRLTSSPLNLAINNHFWQELNQRLEMADVVSQIPKSGSIVAPNNVLSRFITRPDQVYLLSTQATKYNPDFFIVETEKGQNPNNYWGPQGAISFENVLDLDRRLATNSAYQLQPYSKETIHVYRHN